MTKGVPHDKRTCLRCGQSYQPSSGPQKFCPSCIPLARRFYTLNWRKRNPEKRREIDRRVIAKNPEYWREVKKYQYSRWRERLKIEVFDRYSNGTFRCACCDESELDFLVIDHINGRGNEHRREIFGETNAGGWRMHRWLFKQGFPQGFQLLCANCNTSKGKHGECVHRRPLTVPPKPARPDKT